MSDPVRESVKSRIIRSAEHLRDLAEARDDGNLQWFHAGVFDEALGLIRVLEAELAQARTMLSAARQDRDHYVRQLVDGHVVVEGLREERDALAERLARYRRRVDMRSSN